MNTLTGQKAVLAEVRQREFEAYNQVKKSCHMVEQAQLEKAEVHTINISSRLIYCVASGMHQFCIPLFTDKDISFRLFTLTVPLSTHLYK